MRDRKPVMAYADAEQRQMLAQLAEVTKKTQSKVLLDLIEEKHKQLFSSSPMVGSQ
jgi:hypothetical protein